MILENRCFKTHFSSSISVASLWRCQEISENLLHLHSIKAGRADPKKNFFKKQFCAKKYINCKVFYKYLKRGSGRAFMFLFSMIWAHRGPGVMSQVSFNSQTNLVNPSATGKPQKYLINTLVILGITVYCIGETALKETIA